ncbi:MAG: phosphate ABC transporter ATP-binding protein [Acidimicrobiales bacterium]|nr:phosphate ABC transporter ATP-binding protein [Acidimicrobiales bacterium]
MPPEVDLFAFEGVRLVVDGVTVLDGVDARIPADGLTAIVGPSGSGKSTLLRLCNRLEVPTEGRVRFRRDDLAVVDPLHLRRRVGMVFQRPTLFPGTVADNLEIARPGVDPDEAADALHRAGLDRHFLDRTADDLSGGEAQRACLARTLLTRPEVLLMDEPTSALDEESTRVLEHLGVDLADGGVPVLWVTHDPHQVDRIADRRLRMARGRVVEGGDGP